MVRKIKTSEVNIENVSYDAVVETVTKADEATNEEPVKQEMPSGNGHHVDNVAEQLKQETVQNVLERQKQEMPPDNGHQFDNVAVQLEKKPKKEAEKGTCPNCGKTMTLKNLKYSHSKKCNVNTDTELKEEIMEIPKPILVRTDSTLPPEEIETSEAVKNPEAVKKPEAIKKSKSAVKTKAIVEVIAEEPVEVVEVPTVQKKPRTTRPKKVPESVAVLPSEPVVMKKSRAVLKAEKYETLFQNAI